MTFKRLIDPLGWNIFIATLLLTAAVTVSLFASVKLGKTSNQIKLYLIAETVLRPLLDQCDEDKVTGKNVKLRIIFLSWLFYCLIITATYRSELISHLMKPPVGQWLETFQDLAGDKERYISQLGSRAGQSVQLYQVLATEFDKGVTTKKSEMFRMLYKRLYRSEGSIFPNMSQGTVNILSDSFILSRFCDEFEQKYGIRYYDLSQESLLSYVFWSVKNGPFQKEILEIFKWLRDSGILNLYNEQQDYIDKIVIKQSIKLAIFNTKHFEKWNNMEEKEIMEFRNGPKTLKMQHIYILVIILVVGFTFTSAVFICELMSKEIVEQCRSMLKLCSNMQEHFVCLIHKPTAPLYSVTNGRLIFVKSKLELK